MSRVELVVCAYGDSPYLERCLQTLLGQADATLTVATSTPTPRIAALARAAGARCLVNPRRGGIGADWNFAYRSATAPLVTLCHQDDEYASDYAASVAAAIDAAPDVLLATCDHIELDAAGARAPGTVLRVKRRLIRRAFAGAPLQPGPAIRRRLLSWGNPVACSGVMFNKRLLPDFAFDERLSSNLDWDAWERIARLPGRLAYVDRPLVGRRVHAGSATTALIADATRAREDREMLARFWPTPVAALVHALYRQAYGSNRVEA